MVGLRGSELHPWVVAAVAVLVLSRAESTRAQSHESPRRAGYTALVSVPAETGGSGDVDGDTPAATLGPPPNLMVPPGHRNLVRRMWDQSATFRRQCQRIGAARTLTVHVHAVPRPPTSEARTRLVHRPGSGLVADLYLSQVDRAVELLAHELEHIIERVDGIDLHQMTRRVPDLVWTTSDGMYETRRAIHSGQTVASEVAMARK